MPRSSLPALLTLLALCLAGCGGTAGTGVEDEPARTAEATGSPGQVEQAPQEAEPPVAPTPEEESAASGVPDGERLQVRVVGERPHDPTAFTQGLEFDQGQLFESRGLFADQESTILTEIDPADGSTIRSVARPPAPDVFAEGLTVIGDRIIQLTWRSSTALVYDRDTLAREGTFTYTGEGWGICDSGDVLYMSNGTSTLTTRDPATFLPLATVEVTLDGLPVERLNELECVGDRVWANVWQTNSIVVIDPATGEVTTTVDASPIADRSGRLRDNPGQADVLNGIAYDPESDVWLLTGKLWPVMYEVAFDCVDGCPDAEPLSYYIRPAR